MNERILLAEANPTLRTDLSRYLSSNNYTVESVSSGTDTLCRVETFSPDLIILDALLSEGKASLCEEIRKSSSVPIILTSPRATVADKVHGLEAGADDFLLKPCDMRELGARAKAVLRRSRILDRAEDNRTITLDKLELSIDKYELRLNGDRVDLTPKELQLLYFLASNPNKVYTRDQLLDQVWGYNYLGNTRTIDAHVRKVREKCEGVSDQWTIRTVWGVGYKFETA
ncbi:MAG: response regulator transcription factor [Clostridia bacterium]|nr:response regulator transcription factor [Clostridia bacterium]